MKRMIGALLCLILTVLPLSACTQKTEVSCEAIDRRYTAAYDSVETPNTSTLMTSGRVISSLSLMSRPYTMTPNMKSYIGLHTTTAPPRPAGNMSVRSNTKD